MFRFLISLAVFALMSVSAPAQMSMLGVTGNIPVSEYSYIGYKLSSTSCTICTFAATPIGTASPDRIVYVALGLVTVGVPSVSGVTIDGISATQVASYVNTVNATRLELWAANVPTNTAVDIVATLSGALNSYPAQLRVWSATGMRRPFTAIASNFYLDNANPGGSPYSVAGIGCSGSGIFFSMARATTGTALVWGSGITNRNTINGNGGSVMAGGDQRCTGPTSPGGNLAYSGTTVNAFGVTVQ